MYISLQKSHSLVVWCHCFDSFIAIILPFFCIFSDLWFISDQFGHYSHMGNYHESVHWLLNPCSRLRDICPHLLWFLRLNKLNGRMNVNKENGHVENNDEAELKSSCELFVPSSRILLSEFKSYRSACLTFFPLDLHRLCLCVECEGLKDHFVNFSIPKAHTALW